MLDGENTETCVLVCGLLAADVVFNVDTIPADAIKYRANKVSLKCGGGGCYASIAINRLGGNACLLAQLGDSEVVTVAAPTITAVDTLGAGDVWHGAFTLQLAQGFDEISAVRFANVAAALKCASTGDDFTTPQLRSVTQFIVDGYE